VGVVVLYAEGRKGFREEALEIRKVVWYKLTPFSVEYARLEKSCRGSK